MVRAFAAGATTALPWENARTAALGLRVPAPFADALILRAIAESGGTALAVSEDELLDGMTDLAEHEGCFACPEGGATLAALRRLKERGDVRAADRVVIYNTGSGLKYPEAWTAALARRGRTAAYIGPLIATTASVVDPLLDHMLARLCGEEVCLDLHRGGRMEPDMLARRGLTKRRVLTRMVHGRPSAAGTSPMICASSGPEFG